MKAYTTRVGEGPYPTEIHGDLAETLRAVGAEYGTTTGRPRRVGWLDIPALQYVTRWDHVFSEITVRLLRQSSIFGRMRDSRLPVLRSG